MGWRSIPFSMDFSSVCTLPGGVADVNPEDVLGEADAAHLP